MSETDVMEKVVEILTPTRRTRSYSPASEPTTHILDDLKVNSGPAGGRRARRSRTRSASRSVTTTSTR